MWREGYLTGGESRFWVRVAGHGDDVALLLHGFPHDGGVFERVAALLVDAGWRVVAPDVKGVGRSDTPSDGYDPQTLADEVSQLVRSLHVRRVLLVGHDWGGAIALATAFRHPGHVLGLVLLGSPYRQLDLRRAWHIALCNLPVLPELAFRVAPVPLVACALRLQTSVREAYDRDDVRAAAAATRGGGWLSYYRTLSRRAVVDGVLRRVRRRVPGLGEPEPPHELRVPVHVIWGGEDPVFPVDLGTRVAQDLHASLDVLPGVGHHPHVEDPLAVARSIQAFAGANGIGPGAESDVPAPTA